MQEQLPFERIILIALIDRLLQLKRLSRQDLEIMKVDALGIIDAYGQSNDPIISFEQKTPQRKQEVITFFEAYLRNPRLK